MDSLPIITMDQNFQNHFEMQRRKIQKGEIHFTFEHPFRVTSYVFNAHGILDYHNLSSPENETLISGLS